MDDPTSLTSLSLLRRARSGDQLAWHALVETYGRRIYRWSRRRGLQGADAANITQEVLRSVASRIEDFQHHGHAGSFRGWLYRITENKIKDFQRAGGRALDLPRGGTTAHGHLLGLPNPAPTAPNPGEATDDNSQPRIPPHVQQTIDEVRLAISDRDWRVFWRVAVDGQSSKEAGEEFGISDNAVRLIKMRVIRRFKKALQDPP